MNLLILEFLPCDHSFCQTCIDRIKKGSQIKCPVCSTIHEVKNIRPDFKLSQFIDALKKKEKQERGDTGEGKVLSFKFYDNYQSPITETFCS